MIVFINMVPMSLSPVICCMMRSYCFSHSVALTPSWCPPWGVPWPQLVTSHLSNSQLLRIKDVSAVTRWPRAPFPGYLVVNFWKSVYSRPRRVLEKLQQTSPTDFSRESAVEPQGDVPCCSQRDVLCCSHTFYDLKSSMHVEVPLAQNPGPPGVHCGFFSIQLGSTRFSKIDSKNAGNRVRAKT